MLEIQYNFNIYRLYPFTKKEDILKQLSLLRRATVYKYKERNYYFIINKVAKQTEELFIIDLRGSFKSNHNIFQTQLFEEYNFFDKTTL